MASYPTLKTELTSRRVVLHARVPVRATNLALKVRELASADKIRFELEHKLGTADRTTLANFYGTNRNLDVTYVWPGIEGGTHTVRFASSPQYDRLPGLNILARVVLEEV